MWDALNSMMHGLWEFFTGLYAYFGFWIFVAAMAALALMPPAERKTFNPTAAPAPSTPPPQPAPSPANAAQDKKNETRLQRLERMAYVSLMSVLHHQKQLPAQPPVQIHLVSPHVSLDSPGGAPQLSAPQTIDAVPPAPAKRRSLSEHFRSRMASLTPRRQARAKILSR